MQIDSTLMPMVSKWGIAIFPDEAIGAHHAAAPSTGAAPRSAARACPVTT